MKLLALHKTVQYVLSVFKENVIACNNIAYFSMLYQGLKSK